MSETTRARSSPASRPLLVAGVTVALLFLLVADLKNYRDLRQARQAEAALRQRIVETRARVDELEKRGRRLREDPEAVERLAREELGMARPGEVVILLPLEDEAPGERAAASPLTGNGGTPRE